MESSSITVYLWNCVWLLLPIMAWNMLFTSKLPHSFSRQVFWKDIPASIANGETIFRLLIFILPILMPLRIETQSQKLGLWLYVAGTAIYFLSWLAQMYFPHSAWSLSAFGFLAPAYTPLIWLVGIGLIGSSLYFTASYRSWMYVALSVLFVAFHLSHSITVYQRGLRKDSM